VTRPILVDLCCKQGGAAMGYHRAGFDVLGVDNEPQPRYPFAFVQADALEFLAFANLSSIAAIHGSPPCKGYTRTGWSYHFGYHQRHPDLLTPMREALERTGLPWVIENVPGAPMRADLKLCGCTTGLPELERERWFETSWRAFDLRQPCHRTQPTVSPRGNTHYKGEAIDWARAMGIDWMNAEGLSQAIPPAYTEYIGRALIEHIAGERAA
jgi:DNA (cytosine-5)-methyltransferase 1